MKTTTTLKTRLAKAILAVLFFTSAQVIHAQCSASFTYSNVGGGLVNFTNTSVGTSSSTTYFWAFGTGATSIVYGGTGNTSYTYPYNGVFTTTLVINDSLGCSSGTLMTVTVTGLPCNGNISFSPTFGQNGVVNFANTSTGLGQNSSWQWYFGDGGSSTLFSPSHTYTSSGVYNVILSGQDNAGVCSYTTSQTITVTVGTCSLNAAFSYSNVGGGTVNFTSLSTFTTIYTNYYWTFGDGGWSTAVNPSHTYLSNGNYNVTLNLADSSGFNCTDNYSQNVNLTGPCLANVSFSMLKDSLVLPAISWDAYPNYPLNIQSATWYWGDGNSTNSLYPSHTYSAAGLYNICVVITTTCGATATACVNSNIYRGNSENAQIAQVTVVNPNPVPTGINQNTAVLTDVKLFPNPNNGSFELNINGAEEKAEIAIYNIIGKQVYSSVETSVNGNVNKKLNLEELAAGTYFVKMTSGNKYYNSKLVIAK